ncbi:glucosyltransferase domain-containing protein [Planococcus sp. ISL-110]|uniref:glucosyltransferase domain-containing protein n=1 Tax=Planococcus sp. ISL-110 TaxID=2819167 RepID=UPI001BE6CFFB|nr:glucosyltransferase domain-containing protein [Planococcus sp. ISL-110]MBT2571250.1 glucosyltransferase domain-containing protein [Planococcus sp. ISL-110]
MPEEFLLKWKTAIRPQWKTAFLSAAIIGFLCHMFVFTNTLPNHDSLVNVHSPQLKANLGRFFLSPFSGISSYFDLPWINGTLSILYLALAAVILTELFQLKKTFSIVAISGLLVTFPTIASTFSYMFTADGYMFGSLLTVLALLITKTYKYGFVPGSIIFYLGVGVYQANLPFLSTLMIIFLISEILGRKITFPQLKSYVLRFFGLGTIGMALYAVNFKLYTSFFAGDISSYQGLDSVGDSNGSIFDRFKQVSDSFSTFFFEGFNTDLPINLFEWLNVGIFLLIAVGFVLLLIQNRIFTNIPMTLTALALLLLMPLSAYILYFVSSDVTYHMLMVLSLVSFYILPVLFYEHLSVPTIAAKSFSWLSLMVVFVTVFNFALISNISYLNMELKYEKSTAFVNRLISRVEQTEGVTPESKLAFIGRVQLDSTLSSNTIPENIPRMTGPLGQSIIPLPYHYSALMKNYFGVSYNFVSEQERQEIAAADWFEEMEAWPSLDSVRVIDDVVVVKLQE